MQFTYRGLGYLALLVPLFTFGISAAVFGHDAHRAQRISLLAAAALIWFLGRHWNRESRESGEPAAHQLAGLPMQWHALVVVAIVLISLR